ncbi:LysR family transcriptional regulator [Aurantiacibacter gilvus]|uniref:LysR family transcriptional regulator n=1 Tax=Aurantiacibacter gilvus TaxID=3139141 RepID=A0ABU9I9E7_9SPHN
MPTLRQLEVFLAAARLGSIGKAADSLGVSQPGASKQVKALEKQLGRPLFTRRRGASSELTEFGHEMMSRAHELIETQRRFDRWMQAQSRTLHPVILVRPFLVSRISNQLANLFPKDGHLQPVFRVTDDYQEANDLVSQLEGRCMLRHVTNVPDDANLLTRVIQIEACSLYMCAGEEAKQPLAKPLDVNSVRWLLPSGTPGLHSWSRHWMEAAGVRRENIEEGTQFLESNLNQIVKEGGGGLFMESHVRAHKQKEALVRVDAKVAPVYLVLMARNDYDRENFDEIAETLAAI